MSVNTKIHMFFSLNILCAYELGLSTALVLGFVHFKFYRIIEGGVLRSMSLSAARSSRGEREQLQDIFTGADMDMLPAGVLASLRSLSVSDSEARSPEAPRVAPVMSKVSQQEHKASGPVEMLKQLKEVKRAAKRARDAAPTDVDAQERYKTAKKRYKEMKKKTKHTKAVMPLDTSAASEAQQKSFPPSDEIYFPPSDEKQRATQQHAQRSEGSRQAQHVQQQVVSEMSPRVAAAAHASRLRRESGNFRACMSSLTPEHEIGSNGDSKSSNAKRRVRFAKDVSTTATKSPEVISNNKSLTLAPAAGSSSTVGASSGKSSALSSSGKCALNSGKVSKTSSEKGASQNSIPVSAPIPESRRRTNSGKITKYQQYVNYASGPAFHEEWHARREEWLSNYSNAETIRKYRPYVNKFIQYIQQQGNVHKHPKDAITRTLVNQFQQDVKTHATPSNQTMILSATSSFLKHLAEEDVTPKDRSKHIKIPAAPKPKKKKDLTIEQVKSIMNATDNQKAKALIAAAYFAGLRTKETVHLTASKCKTVDGNMTITVTKASAKGKKERDVPIAAMGAKLLKPFIETAKARGGHQYLFPGRFKDTHIVEKTMWNYIKKPARAVGLEEVASHHFRHAFASHGAQSGVDIATIKDQMGHSSLKTTSKYVHGKKDHASSVSASLDAAFEDKPAAPAAAPAAVPVAAPAAVPVAAPSAPQTGRSATQELVQLVNMFKEGLLTKEEFIAAKRNLSILQ